MRTTTEKSKLFKMINPVDGRMTRMNSMAALWSRSFWEGLKVCSALKAVLCWRCGRKKAGDPSQEVFSLAASPALAGGTDKQPIRQLSPMAAPGGSKALLPIKE